MKKILLNSFFIFSFSFFVHHLFAQAGTLDSSFGTNGFADEGFGISSYANSVALQADGKIVLGGTKQNPKLDGDYALMRFNPDGSLDSTFGINGVVTTTFGPNSVDIINAIVIQPDGKIIAAGVTLWNQTQSLMSIARYMPDGTLDSSFRNNGKDTLFGNIAPSTRTLLLQPDGKIVVGGDHFYFNGGQNEHAFFTARFNADGTIDNSYGLSGLSSFYIHLGTGPNHCFGNKMVLQQDGKIILTGHDQIGNNTGNSPQKIIVLRFNANGTIDNTFGGGDGWLVSSINKVSYTQAATVSEDGKILVGGFTDAGSSGFDFFLSKYLPDGSVDDSFGVNGTVTTDINGISNLGYSVAINDNNKILFGGYSHAFATQYSDFALLQYNANGTLDSSFGVNGVALTAQTGCRNNAAFDMALQTNGDIILAGRIDDPPCVSLNYQNFGLVRVIGNNLPKLSIKNIAIKEGDAGTTAARFKIKIDKPSSNAITVNYTTKNGTAKAGSDYVSKTGTATIEPGDTSAVIRINVIGGTNAEQNERFYLQLSSAENAIIDGNGIAACIIGNDDGAEFTNNSTDENKISLSNINLKIFPNPVKNILKIEGLTASANNILSIVDASGKVVTTVNTSTKNYSWNIQDLNAGVYYLVVTVNSRQTASLKFVKE